MDVEVIVGAAAVTVMGTVAVAVLGQVRGTTMTKGGVGATYTFTVAVTEEVAATRVVVLVVVVVDFTVVVVDLGYPR